MKIRAGHFFAARYNGKNGDLIVGRVKSVRQNGEVILVNLLSGTVSTKKAEVLKKRNKRISKNQASQLVRIYKKTDDKQVVRENAVAMDTYQEQRKVRKKKSVKEIEILVASIIGICKKILEGDDE